MDPLLIAVLVGGPTLVYGAYLVHRALSRPARLQRAALRLPVTLIAQVRDGDRVRIRGSARPAGPLLTAPLSGRACIGFELTAWWHAGEEVPMPGPSSVIRRIGTLLVEDATGVALVDGAEADVLLVPDVTAEGRAALEALFPADSILANGHVSGFLEAVLLPDQAVVACGVAQPEWVPDAKGERGFRDAPQRVRLRPSKDLPLLVTNEPKHLSR